MELVFQGIALSKIYQTGETQVLALRSAVNPGSPLVDRTRVSSRD